jgi:CRISPR-associated DxTHG motif protein
VKLAISFLGTGDYKEVRYKFDGLSSCTRLFPSALPVFFPDLEEVFVLVTRGSRERWWPHLEKIWPRAEESPRLAPVEIPEGGCEGELWEIFEKIVKSIPEGSSVVFDITHSFRSLPLICLLAVAYLKSARKVHMERLIYGAYEARDQQNGVAPVFDLTPMATLLDWLFVYQRFSHSLDARGLAQLLRQIQGQAHQAQTADAPRRLQGFGEIMEKFTAMLNLGRIGEILKAVPKIRGATRDTQTLHEAKNWAKPLEQILPLIDHVAEKIGPTGDDDLKAHLNLAHVYFEKGFYMQAISLIREWLVSRFCLEYDAHADVCEKCDRMRAEKGLNYLANKKSRTDQMEEEPDLPTVPSSRLDCYAALWNRVRDVRNDVDHLGFKKEPLPPDKIVKHIEECLRMSRKLSPDSRGGPHEQK